MAKAERYQMGFDFPRRRSSIEYEMTSTWYNEENQAEGVSRFTRTLREPITIQTPTDAAHHLLANIFTPFDAFEQEELWSLLLNTKNRITHEVMIYRGNIDSVHIRQAEVFREAIRFNARGLILSHLHPSGDPSPSNEDVLFNEESRQIASMLGLNLLDHIIVGNGAWVSLREQGKW